MTAPTQRFCSHCGAPVTGGRFCSGCGTALVAPEAPTVVLPPPAVAPHVEHEPEVETLLPFEDVEPGPEPAGRRRGVLVGVSAVLVVALAGGATLLVRHLGGADARNAVAASSTQFRTAVSALASATSIDEVAGAAGTAADAAERVQRAQRRLGTPSGRTEQVVAEQLEAEHALLSALGGLVEVADEPLDAWGGSHGDIVAAVEQEQGTRAELAEVDGDAARALPDTGAMLTSLTGTVGGALASDATGEAVSLVASLKAAATTADLRELGDAATAEAAAVGAAAEALEGAPSGAVLEAYGDVVSAVGGMSKIDGDSLGSWKAARSDLAAGLGALASAAAKDPAAPRLRSGTGPALAAVDAMVKKAEAKMADWKAAHAAAAEERKEDSTALGYYTEAFRSQLKGYEQLRGDLSDFFERVEAPDTNVSYYEGFEFLSGAVEARRDVRDGLTASAVPDEVQQQHDALIAVVDRAITAVQAAYDGVSQASDCVDVCYYRDTPGWAVFQEESEQISKDYTKALQAWESAASAAKGTIANRPLPAKPSV